MQNLVDLKDKALIPQLPQNYFEGMEKDLEPLRDMLKEWRDSKDRIGIFTHDDGDGVCSAAILNTFFKDSFIYIPDRREFGYGYPREVADLFRDKGINKIVIADNALKSVSGCAYGKSIGQSIILIDHHTSNEDLPDVDLLFNPQVKKEDKEFSPDFPLRNQCSAALCYAILSPLSPSDLQEELLVYAAIGTQSDFIPQTGFARSILYHGFTKFPKLFPSIWMELGDGFLQEKWINLIRVLNMLRGTGGNHLGLNLLLEPFKYKDCIRETLGKFTHQEEYIAGIIEKAEYHDNYCISDLPDLEIELIGLVASRLVRKHGCFSISIGRNDRGEVRSLSGGDNKDSPYALTLLDDAAKTDRDFFLMFGGHPNACGFTLNKDKREDFLEWVRDYLKDKNLPVLKEKEPEYELKSSEYKQARRSFRVLLPYGSSNPVPSFRLYNDGDMELIREDLTEEDREKQSFTDFIYNKREYLDFMFYGDGLRIKDYED